MLGRVPASVVAFTGYRIAGDPFTSLLGFGDYRAAAGGNPPARVRNVLLPSQVSHVNAFEVDGYAEHPQLRAWIDAYQPGSDTPPPDATGLDLSNLRHAADLWHSLKKHWALQARQWAAQRAVRRGLIPGRVRSSKHHRLFTAPGAIRPDGLARRQSPIRTAADPVLILLVARPDGTRRWQNSSVAKSPFAGPRTRCVG